MLARIQLTLAAALTLVALALAGVYLLGSGGDVAATGRHLAIGPEGFVGAVAPPGVRPARFTLTDQDGRRVSLAAYRGKVVVMTFMYATCQDTCPTTASTIRVALDALGERTARDVPTLAVSVDPVNDTDTNAKAFLAKQGLSGRMDYLLGTRAQLEPVWASYGVQPQAPGRRPADVDPRSFDHSARVIVLDAGGRQRVAFPLDALSPEGLAHDIRRVRAGA